MPSPGDTRLVLDVMVGGLRSILRMAGYDTIYALDRDAETDEAVIAIAERDSRVLITRDQQIAQQYDATVLLESTDSDEQLQELMEDGFVLELDEPTRCSRCNGEVRAVDAPTPGATVPADWPADGPDPGQEPVWRCLDCGQYYWKGSHWDDVRRRLDRITKTAGD